jgi:hypothetical protein
LVVKLQRLAGYGLLGQVLYIGWAIWLGVKLSRLERSCARRS